MPTTPARGCSLAEDAAVISRYGFNNEGFERAGASNSDRLCLIGVNPFVNKTADRSGLCARRQTFAPLADYLTINARRPIRRDPGSDARRSTFD
jgi:dihydroorotate dehydrogenase